MNIIFKFSIYIFYNEKLAHKLKKKFFILFLFCFSFCFYFVFHFVFIFHFLFCFQSLSLYLLISGLDAAGVVVVEAEVFFHVVPG